MADLDIQTAQLIIQLARDDIYQLDDNAFNGNNQNGDSLSDLEFALAEQEREFMQHWTDYGDTQIGHNANAARERSGGGRNVGSVGNVGFNMRDGGRNAVAGSSHVINSLATPTGIPNRATPVAAAIQINHIDGDDDDDDFYVNPYEASVPPSSSNSGNDNSNGRNQNSSNDQLINLEEEIDPELVTQLFSLLTTATGGQPITSGNTVNRVQASTSTQARWAIADADDEWHAQPPSTTTSTSNATIANTPPSDLEQFLELARAFTSANSISGGQGTAGSITVNRAQASTSSRAGDRPDERWFAHVGPSNSVPQRVIASWADSPSSRPASPDNHSDLEYIYESPGVVNAPLLSVTASQASRAVSPTTGLDHAELEEAYEAPQFEAVYEAVYETHQEAVYETVDEGPQFEEFYEAVDDIPQFGEVDEAVDEAPQFDEVYGSSASVVTIPLPTVAVSSKLVCLGVVSDGEGASESGLFQVSVEPNVECHFCKDIRPISTTISTSCNHRLCRGCILRLVGICLKDETAYPPKCCGNKLQPNELHFLDPSLRQRFVAKVREYETPIPVRVYCHRCGEFLDSNSSTITTGSSSKSIVLTHTSRYCNTCFLLTCVSCKQASHPTRECRETPEERALKSLAKQRGWQTCPDCKAVVELSAGCYHIMCRCTAQFCYLCATTWKQCNCPAFEEERLMEMAA